jgi:hypothetical protein
MYTLSHDAAPNLVPEKVTDFNFKHKKSNVMHPLATALTYLACAHVLIVTIMTLKKSLKYFKQRNTLFNR